MPNGNAEFHAKDEAKLEDFFRPIANLLSTFAQRHNLKLEKYYHQSPSWSFTFRHPQGGISKIEVSRRDAGSVRLICSWWYDDYEAVTRFIKDWESEPLACDSQIVSIELEKALTLVSNWQFGTWDRSSRGYDSWKTTWSKNQFEELPLNYPILKT